MPDANWTELLKLYMVTYGLPGLLLAMVAAAIYASMNAVATVREMAGVMRSDVRPLLQGLTAAVHELGRERGIDTEVLRQLVSEVRALGEAVKTSDRERSHVILAMVQALRPQGG